MEGVAKELREKAQEILMEGDANPDEALKPYGGFPVQNELCVDACDRVNLVLDRIPIRQALAAVWAIGCSHGVASERFRMANDALESIPVMNPDACRDSSLLNFGANELKKREQAEDESHQGEGLA